MKEILDYLLNNKIITSEQLSDINAESVRMGYNIEEILLNRRIVQDSELLEIKSNIFKIPYVNLSGKKIPEDVLNIITKELADNYKCIVFNKSGLSIDVCMLDPKNYNAKEALEFVTRKKGYNINYFVTTISSLSYAFKQYNKLENELEDVINESDDKQTELKEQKKIEDKMDSIDEKSSEESPISRMVSTIIKHAVEEGASDIHIEPTKDDIRVRYRVDGILYTSITLQKYMHNSIVSRIKVIAGLKIDETRIPQDGRIRLNINSKFYDFRISIVPISDGEKIVMRILDTSKKAPTLKELGIESNNLEVMNQGLKASNGMLLVCGPTGSGKSMTLFSALTILNNEEVNIATLEDPIEYVVRGVNHSQVRPEIGYTFANGIRSFLRQDPDIIMVGEIRDNETAELCIHAGLTGHLVLSTLHTNDAMGAIPRLMDMHIEPFLLASCLNLILSQRLIRKICNQCKVECLMDEKIRKESTDKIKNIPKSILEAYGISKIDDNTKFYKGSGCVNCGNTGYKGRIAILETIKITENMRKIIEKGAQAQLIEEELKNQNFVSIEQDGIIKAIKGIISLSDVESTIKE